MDLMSSYKTSSKAYWTKLLSHKLTNGSNMVLLWFLTIPGSKLKSRPSTSLSFSNHLLRLFAALLLVAWPRSFGGLLLVSMKSQLNGDIFLLVQETTLTQMSLSQSTDEWKERERDDKNQRTLIFLINIVRKHKNLKVDLD